MNCCGTFALLRFVGEKCVKSFRQLEEFLWDEARESDGGVDRLCLHASLGLLLGRVNPISVFYFVHCEGRLTPGSRLLMESPLVCQSLFVPREASRGTAETLTACRRGREDRLCA